MFESVLIANRGEIAVRVAKTLRKMGIRSVVVASIPDRRSLAVRTADDWVLLEGYSAAESYLDVDAVIAAAKERGCQAIHPGYGFLAERADFAERCAAEGIVFIGPSPDVLRGVGDKSAARQLAVANGVPVVPGWDREDDLETLTREAGRIGYPVMLKARGGGGGRGMREVFQPAELPEAIESARREAQAAFGDGGLLIEKLVTEAHHVEVQILGDSHGNLIHLGERDCSVQRRHQKLIEESPSPVVDDELRAELTGAALKLARAVNYVNAGTFEFLVGAPGTEGRRPFYFLEVNPRLQVEHPVTEMVTGLDLVELQVRVAAGEPLPIRQEDVKFEGHAIEFRINAEDPWDGFRPSSGRILSANWGFVERIDRGYQEGDVVPSAYDSLLAKVIMHAPSRGDAIDFATVELGEIYVRPLRTNVDLIEAVRRSAAFGAGECHTGWLEKNLDSLLEGVTTPDSAWFAAAFAITATDLIGSVGGRHVWLDNDRRTQSVRVERSGTDVVGRIGDIQSVGRVLDARTVEEVWKREVSVRVGGEVYDMRIRGQAIYGGLRGDERAGLSFHLVPPPPLPRRAHAATEGATAITAPLAGTIAAVRVAEGDAVQAGQALVMLEAMKMEHRITATVDGVVRAIHVQQGDVVREGDLLAELE
ncbi:MAG TPA: biotin carboxylase N-terminal domain-containing protein [Tepidiformaceae bacterium]|nr:biotin carboxylase N-terminal domain-containing protein [Tepidiformaceae bacterium]